MQVTAVIPVHNHCLWVNDAIDSVARQDYPDKRISVVDDGSTDSSFDSVVKRLYKPQGRQYENGVVQVLGKLMHTDVLMMVSRLPKAGGPAAARNFGINVGWEDTDVFALLDSDDMYEPGKISKSMEVFKDAPDQVGVVYSDFDTLNPDGLRLRQWKEPFSRERLVRECLVNCDSLVSKKALEACGLFDETLRVCEDYDLWLRISERFVLVHIPESLVQIRVGPHSSSSSVAKPLWEENYRRVMMKAQARANGQ